MKYIFCENEVKRFATELVGSVGARGRLQTVGIVTESPPNQVRWGRKGEKQQPAEVLPGILVALLCYFAVSDDSSRNSIIKLCQYKLRGSGKSRGMITVLKLSLKTRQKESCNYKKTTIIHSPESKIKIITRKRESQNFQEKMAPVTPTLDTQFTLIGLGSRMRSNLHPEKLHHT